MSTCVAWSPDDIDGRGYDVVAFARASDILYIMDYDTRSQVMDIGPYFSLLEKGLLVVLGRRQ